MTSFPSFEEFFADLWAGSLGDRPRPFPWQTRLAQDALAGRWPRSIQLPTGSGKTSIVDVWVWALAAGAAGVGSRHPRRLFFVIDRRIVVDSVFDHADAIATALERAEGGAVQVVASALLSLGGGTALRPARLRGGLEIDRGWADDLAQPLACATTVDQLGSRLLFRGYGLSRGPRNPLPIHAALVGMDSLLVLDEAHLSAPFDETLSLMEQVRTRAGDGLSLPWHCVRMTATPRPTGDLPFILDASDEGDERLHRRLSARKPARLVEVPARGGGGEPVGDRIVDEVDELLERGTLGTIGVVVNRVMRARAIADRLRTRHADTDVLLLIGPSRPADRDRAVASCWPRLRAGRRRDETVKPLVVVATQTIEVGVDIDLDALVTECAPVDSLRQRFGRLDRLGELDGRAAGLIVHAPGRGSDPIYGDALDATWDWLSSQAEDGVVDAGPRALTDPPPETLAPTAHAPILFPAYLDRLAQTSPLPDPDPAVEVFLHGYDTRPADVEIVWRADLDPDEPRVWRDIVALVPPSGREAVRIGFVQARRWLAGLTPADLGDTEGGTVATVEEDPADRLGLRWRGAHDDDTRAVRVSELRPGDTILVPAAYGGCDHDGWVPASRESVFDLAEQVAAEIDDPVLRLHPAVLAQHELDPSVADRLLVPDEDDPATLVPDVDAVDELLALIAHQDSRLSEIVRMLGDSPQILVYPHRRGVLVSRRDEVATLGDDDGELAGGEVTLREHQDGVAAEAERLARAVGLDGGFVNAIREAARRHDEGKRDPRFQRLLLGGSPLAEAEPLAKSRIRVRDTRTLRQAWQDAGLPQGFRHEAGSVALVDDLDDKLDESLVRHLVASHHGCARPFFRLVQDAEPWIDTSHLERVDGETPERFWELVRRYGWWGLAYLETVLRLADHRRSAEEQRR